MDQWRPPRRHRNLEKPPPVCGSRFRQQSPKATAAGGEKGTREDLLTDRRHLNERHNAAHTLPTGTYNTIL